MSIVISYIGTDVNSFGIMSNSEVSAKARKAALNQARRHLCARVIPRMGKAILAMRTSSEDRVLSKHVQDGEHFVNVPVLCDCGGEFVADKHGEYVCNKCGIINAFEDNFTFESSEEDDEPLEDTTYEDGDSSPAADAYTKAKDGAIALEARLAAHQEAWKADKAKRPEDEQYAKYLARARKERHDAIMKANRESTQKLLYEAKWQEAQRQYRLRRILAFVKDGVTDTAALRQALNVTALETFYADMKQLKDDGRITSITVGRRTTLALVARA